MIIVNKVFFLVAALNFQVYEWLNTLLLIKYQKGYDITNVHIVAKRKFRPVERLISNIFFGYLTLVFVVCNLYVFLVKPGRLSFATDAVILSQFLLLWVPLLAVILMFPP